MALPLDRIFIHRHLRWKTSLLNNMGGAKNKRNMTLHAKSNKACILPFDIGLNFC
jgi:hypothetical protein